MKMPTVADLPKTGGKGALFGRGTNFAKPGRVTPEQLRLVRGRADFLQHVKAGMTLMGAAKLADLAWSTVRGWRDRDPSFDAEVREALLHGNASLEDRILKHSIKDWRAADRLLQVRDPERWAPKKDTDVSVSVNLSSTDPAEELKRVQELERKLLGRVVTEFEPLPGMMIDGEATEVAPDE